MTWGGNLTKKGSDHIRKLRDADNVIKFLEQFKEEVNETDKNHVSRTIDLIVNRFTDQKNT
ncbi:MAG: hypothetical protein KGD66_05600 [Candidatus Lokiarchaeota archaeon]|nr:hypothetical protein [Candidatus Lokiarchaeota archaeon]